MRDSGSRQQTPQRKVQIREELLGQRKIILLFNGWLQKSGLMSRAPPSCSEMNAYPALGMYGYTIQVTLGRDNGTVVSRWGNAGKNLVLLWFGVAIE